MDRNALDWLFSTAPQALAALVGLIFTGVAFIHGAIDKARAQDDTSTDIYDEMKREIHTYMKKIFICAGLAIALDLLLIVFNPLEDGFHFSIHGQFDLYLFIAGLVFLFNLFTIGFSLYFVLLVASPSFFKNTVKRLSEALEKGDVEAMSFLKEFRELETALRALPIYDTNQWQRQPTMSEMLGRLKLLPQLKRGEIDRLYELTRLRNIISHNSDINHVDRESYNDVKSLTKKIAELKDQLEET